MPARRLATAVTCAMCPNVFHPWCRQRQGLPTCSIKCARAMTGAAQRGKPMLKALEAKALARLDEAVAVGRRFGAMLTTRELAIYRYGIQVGQDRGYRQRRKAAA